MKHTSIEGLWQGGDLGDRVTIAGALLPRDKAKLLFDRVRASSVRHLTLDGRVVHHEDVRLEAARSFDALEHLELVGFDALPPGLLTARLPSLRTLVVRDPPLSDDDQQKLARAAYAKQINQPLGDAPTPAAAPSDAAPTDLGLAATDEAVARLWSRLTQLGLWIPEGFTSEEAMQADGRTVVVHGFAPASNRIESSLHQYGFLGNHTRGFAWIRMGSRRERRDAFQGSWTQLWAAAQRWATLCERPLPLACTVFGRVDGCALEVPRLDDQPSYTQDAAIGAKIEPWALWFEAGPLVTVAPDHPEGAIFLGETPLSPDLAWYLTTPAPGEISLPELIATDSYARAALPAPLVGAEPADDAPAPAHEGDGVRAEVGWALEQRDQLHFSGPGTFLVVVRPGSEALITGRTGRPRRVRLHADGRAYALHPHRDEIWTFSKIGSRVTHLDTGRTEVRPIVKGRVRLASFSSAGDLIVGVDCEDGVARIFELEADGPAEVLAELPEDLARDLDESVMLGSGSYLAQRVRGRLAVLHVRTGVRLDLDAPEGFECDTVYAHPVGLVIAVLCRQESRRDYRILLLDPHTGEQLAWLPAGRYRPHVGVQENGRILWTNDSDVEIADAPYRDTALLSVPPDRPDAVCSYDGELGVADSERIWWIAPTRPHGRLRYPWAANPTFSARATAVAAGDRFGAPGTLQLETGVLLLVNDEWPDSEVAGVSDDGEWLVLLRPAMGLRVYRRDGDTLERHWSYPGNLFSAGLTGDGRHVAMAEQMDHDDGTTDFVCGIIDLETREPAGFLMGMAKGKVLVGERGVTYADPLSSSDWEPGQSGPVAPTLSYHEDVLRGLDSIEQLELPTWIDRTALGVASIFRDGSVALPGNPERTVALSQTLESLTEAVENRPQDPMAHQLREVLDALATLPASLSGDIVQATVDPEADALAIRVGRSVRCYPFPRGSMAFEADVGRSAVVAWASNLTLAVVNVSDSEAYFLKVDGI